MQKRDDRGFSLIELLVAVTILAIVLVPLLHGFLSSYRVNFKSREVLRATTLAQNEMEIFQKEKIQDLMDPSRFSYSYTMEESSGIYTFMREDISNDPTETGYDVVVTLDPLSGDTQRYHEQNTAALLQMNTISALDSGTYIQPMRTVSNAVGLDEEVYGIFEQNKTTVGGASWNTARFSRQLQRCITLEVVREGGEDGITKAKVTCEYTCGVAGVMKDGYDTYTKEIIIFDNGQLLDEEGNRRELKSLYLFFAPRYDTDATAGNDRIVIRNEQGLPVNIYVVKQEILKTDGSSVWETPLNYKAELSIYDGMTAEGKSRGSYWTNLNLDQPAALGLGERIEFRFYDQADPAAFYSKSDSMDITQIKPIGVNDAKDRIYEMDVKVYRHGADRSTDRPLVTLDGTKLD